MGPAMSNVLPFPKQSPHRSLPDSERLGRSAEILFFTGVRIERHLDDDHQDNRAQRRGSTGGKRHRKA
jgi:hypothetical protein